MIEKERTPKYDIYLAGAWEQYCDVPYKTILKAELPEASIYDPEQHQDGDWFVDDLEAIRNSRFIICYANDIPMSACTFEMGYFYARLDSDVFDSHKIILIWEDIEPRYSQEWHKRCGYIVDNVEEAIDLYEHLNG